MKSVAASLDAADDRLNPIAVKEFRQAVRSRWVIAVLMLFLAINLATLGGYLIFSPSAATSIHGGAYVFLALLSVLMLTCNGFVPAYTAIRLALERNDADLDLLFVTAITPGAIVRGKYLAAMALSLLVFSACLPFMTVTYLLRGIDPPTIFTLLGIALVACAGANALGVFAGSVSGTVLFRAVTVGGTLLVLFFATITTIQVASAALVLGGRLVRGGDFWTGFGIFLLFQVVAIGLLYVLSVALLSPKTSNRMLVPRIYLSVSWAVTGVAMALMSHATSSEAPLLFWTVLSGACLIMGLFLALGERDAWSVRVLRTIPRGGLLRLGAFLLYSGSAGGMLWCVIMFCATLVFSLALAPSARAEIGTVCGNLAMVFGYALCYCLTVAALRPTILRFVPTQNLPVLAVLLGAVVGGLSYLAAFLLAEDWLSALPWFLLASPLVLSTDDVSAQNAAAVLLCLWLLMAVLASLPWAVSQLRRFRRHRATPETDPDANPVLESGNP